MIEIKNPYSRKRFTFKEKLQRKFTFLAVPLIKMIPLKEEKSKIIPKFLKQLRQSAEYWNRDKLTNSKPTNVDVDLLSLYVSEYIPIENVDKLNKGLKKVYKIFEPKRFNTNDISRIDDFCNEVKQSIHGGRWSNFGYLEVGEESDLFGFVKQLQVNGTHISSSSIILQFIITPSDNFVSEFKKLVDSNVKDETILTPSLKRLFSFWGSRTRPGSRVKELLIEDLLLELKWRTLIEISKYFDMYFTSNKLVPPSIEVYKVKQTSCRFKYEENEEKNQFWDSIGLDDFQFHEISKDGFWKLFPKTNNQHLDRSVKITCNSEISKEKMFHSLDFQMVYYVQEFAMNLLPILIMRNYVIDLSKQIAIRQKDTFISIKKEKPKYQKLINIRYELEQNLHILKRFKNEMGKSEFERVKKEIMECISDFEPSRPKFSNISWAETIVDNTSFLIDKTYTHSQNFAKIIDDTVKLLEIKTNNSLRRRTFWLTIFTVILSVAATIFAGLSLYFQLSNENQNSISEIFHSIKNFFI
jgi:hypothetical protein